MRALDHCRNESTLLLTYIKEFARCNGETDPSLVKDGVPDTVAQTSTSHIEYRGYGFNAIEHGSGWRVHISPGPQFLRTQPDHVLASTKEEAFDALSPLDPVGATEGEPKLSTPRNLATYMQSVPTVPFSISISS